MRAPRWLVDVGQSVNAAPAAPDGIVPGWNAGSVEWRESPDGPLWGAGAAVNPAFQGRGPTKKPAEQPIGHSTGVSLANAKADCNTATQLFPPSGLSRLDQSQARGRNRPGYRAPAVDVRSGFARHSFA